MSQDGQRTAVTHTRYGNITLTKAEEQEFREIFNLVDLDGGGSISKTELGQLFHTLNLRVTPQELDLMVHEIDENNDGEVRKMR
jgi:calmodulin